MIKQYLNELRIMEDENDSEVEEEEREVTKQNLVNYYTE